MFTLPQLEDDLDMSIFVINVACDWISTLIFFYFNYFILTPKYLLQRKFLIFLLGAATIFYLNCIFKSFFWSNFNLTFIGQIKPEFIGPAFYNAIMHFFMSTALSVGFFWTQSENRKVALQDQVQSAELAFLKSQINPHFLFNTLNNIYGLVINHDKKVDLAINQLKSIVGYQTTIDESGKQSVAQEIKLLEDFIALNQLRSSVKIEFEKQLPHSNTQIEPMLLLPFVENAFKHGKTESTDSICINLKIEDEILDFSIENTIDPNKRKDEVGGIGIENIKRRLALVYKNRHRLKINSEQGKYKVALQIDLNE